MFANTDLAVIGLHTVFEHHDAMKPVSLEAFLHEYRITFPVGVDSASSREDTPVTMTAYAMQGTPTAVLIDRAGNIAANMFGQIEDLALGALIQSLIDVRTIERHADNDANTDHQTDHCDDGGCTVGVA